MTDREHAEVEWKLQALGQKIADLDYDLRQATRRLENEIYRKADKDHSHEGRD